MCTRYFDTSCTVVDTFPFSFSRLLCVFCHEFSPKLRLQIPSVLCIANRVHITEAEYSCSTTTIVGILWEMAQLNNYCQRAIFRQRPIVAHPLHVWHIAHLILIDNYREQKARDNIRTPPLLFPAIDKI